MNQSLHSQMQPIVFRNIRLKQPTFEELHYTKQLWEDEETMAFNAKWGGTVPFPREQWQSFYDRYCTNQPGYLYYQIFEESDDFVGEVSARWDAHKKDYVLNIKVLSSKRGHHYGTNALIAFLHHLFTTHNASRIIDDVASENIGAIALLQRVGFQIIETDSIVTIMGLSKDEFERQKYR